MLALPPPGVSRKHIADKHTGSKYERNLPVHNLDRKLPMCHSFFGRLRLLHDTITNACGQLLRHSSFEMAPASKELYIS